MGLVWELPGLTHRPLAKCNLSTICGPRDTLKSKIRDDSRYRYFSRRDGWFEGRPCTFPDTVCDWRMKQWMMQYKQYLTLIAIEAKGYRDQQKERPDYSIRLIVCLVGFLLKDQIVMDLSNFQVISFP